MSDVSIGQVIYPTYDAGATGLTPGIQITNKVTGAVLLARTTAGIAEAPSGGGSYDYRAGYTVPSGVAAFKVSWNNSSGAMVWTEDYTVIGSKVNPPLTSVPWPTGTTVGVYSSQGDLPAAAPVGPALATASVASDGTLTFSGLVANRPYVAAATVNGSWVKVRFAG